MRVVQQEMDEDVILAGMLPRGVLQPLHADTQIARLWCPCTPDDGHAQLQLC